MEPAITMTYVKQHSHSNGYAHPDNFTNTYIGDLPIFGRQGLARMRRSSCRQDRATFAYWNITTGGSKSTTDGLGAVTVNSQARCIWKWHISANTEPGLAKLVIAIQDVQETHELETLPRSNSKIINGLAGHLILRTRFINL